MPTQISGHYIPAVLFNLEDVLAATRDPQGRWTFDMTNREHIAPKPEHRDQVASFVAENFFQVNDVLWINPKPLIYARLSGGEVTLDAGLGLLAYQAEKIDLQGLAAKAGLTLVDTDAFVQLDVAEALNPDMIFFGTGECTPVSMDIYRSVAEKLAAAGWVSYQGNTMLNPVKFATRQDDHVAYASGASYRMADFDEASRAVIDALPWKTCGHRQINYLALKNVEPYRSLISPRIQELSRDLIAA